MALAADASSTFQRRISPRATRDDVVIHTELLGEARVIPLDGRPHLPSSVRQWKGDSRGRWEGQTLVVETMNFRAKGIYHLLDLLHGSDESLHVIEAVFPR
jgi:hypothetical protein